MILKEMALKEQTLTVQPKNKLIEWRKYGYACYKTE